MKTVSLVLSTFWAVAQSTPAILRHLPPALALIGKIRTVFGSEKSQEFIKTLSAFTGISLLFRKVVETNL